MAGDNGQEVLKFGIGQPVPRTEDPRLLSGGGRYTDDCDAPGQAYAVFLRSTAAHGEIATFDVSAVADAPGVLAVYTGADLEEDGIGHIPCPVPMKNRDGSSPNVPPRPALAAAPGAVSGTAGRRNEDAHRGRRAGLAGSPAPTGLPAGVAPASAAHFTV